MERIDLGVGSWVERLPDWLTEEEAAHAYQVLTDEIAWEERNIFVRDMPVMQPRLVSWGSDIAYRYSGQTLPPRPLHPLLEAMRLRLVEAYNVPFNHIVLNLYRDGRDHVAMHADNEPELGKDPVVASLSLGGRRKLNIQSKHRKKYRKTFPLVHGEMMVFGGTFQHKFRHGVPKQGEAEPRVNVTFRYLRGDVGWRGDGNGRGEHQVGAADDALAGG